MSPKQERGRFFSTAVVSIRRFNVVLLTTVRRAWLLPGLRTLSGLNPSFYFEVNDVKEHQAVLTQLFAAVLSLRPPRTMVAFVSSSIRCVFASAEAGNRVSQRFAAEYTKSSLSDQQHCVLLPCHANNSEWSVLSEELVTLFLCFEPFLVFTYRASTVLNCNLTRMREKCRWFSEFFNMFKVWLFEDDVNWFLLSLLHGWAFIVFTTWASALWNACESDDFCRAGSFHLQDAVGASRVQRCFHQVALTTLQLLSWPVKSN